MGLDDHFIEDSKQYQDFMIGRVSSQSRDLYKVITEDGEQLARVSGKFRYHTKDLSGFPTVGDFVMFKQAENKQANAVIEVLLSRKTAFIRKAAGKTEEIQVVAANIDYVFICMSLNNDFNPRRLERYLAVAWDSGAVPLVILTKSDLASDIQQKISDIEEIALGVDILVTSIESPDSINSIRMYLKEGKTGAFIGSSGVGKSSLINSLLGLGLQSTSGLRNDDKGRHTTTSRDLFLLREGGIVIDTPGMRELSIVQADFSKSFSDIEELANQCKFRDCSHTSEPKCAVIKAIKDGSMTQERLDSYQKLNKEKSYEGLNSKQINKVKIDRMFQQVGGMKNARKSFKKSNKR